MGSILIALLLQEGFRVEGTKLLDGAGKEVLLRGVSIGDPVLLGAEFRKERFELLAKEWKANAVRISVLPGSWKQKGAAAYDPLLDDALAWCRELGMTAIIDWHAVGNPATGKTFKDKPEFEAAAALARSFWKHAAARHKEKALYEVFHEPMAVTWPELKPVVADLVAVVRQEAPGAVVIVPGPDYTFDLRPIAADPLEAKNILYAWHIYPMRGTGWDAYIGEARKRLPIIATEWGYAFRGDTITTGTTEGFALPLLAMMEEHKIHWTAAAWSPQGPAPLLTGWDGGVTAAGRVVRSWLTGNRPAPRPALKDVADFAVWLRKLDPKALGESKVSLCVVDPEPEGKPFLPDDVDHLKWSPGGPKLLVAYLSIGEAEISRSWWQKDWMAGKPEWIGPEVAGVRRHVARYWDEKWQKIVFESLDRILAQGFDGILLDGIDAYAYWYKKEKDDRAKPRMIDLVGRLSTHAKRKNRNFAVLVRNHEELFENATYLGAIDGIVREELYNTNSGRARDTLGSEKILDGAVKAGKRVFLLEYIKEEATLTWTRDRARSHGYLVSTPDRDLDALPR